MNHLDFLTYQLNVFGSLSPHIPLEENLRCVMAPALAKIRRHCGAAGAFHIFENIAMKEAHAMAIGHNGSVSDALRDELKRRSGDSQLLSKRRELPKYRRFDHSPGGELYGQSKPECKKISKIEAGFLRSIANGSISGAPPGVGDCIIIVPLASREYARLGSVVVWAQGELLGAKFDDRTLHEGLVLFRLYIQRLLISLFSNYYDMGRETYLPSYQCPGIKPVTLLCAQIRGFERLCQVIHQRGDFSAEEKSRCLQSLVNGFTETTAQIVETIGGRVDHLWGSGLVAVFGEYLHKPQVAAAPGCQEALEAGAEIVEALDQWADSWLKAYFRIGDFKKKYADQIDVQAAIAIDHGEVLFDYIGSARRRVFMAVGDRVNFVKQLTTAIGAPCREGEEGCGPPILLSQPAHELSRHVLRDQAKDRVGSVHRQTLIQLPNMPWPVPVFAIWPGNVERTPR